MIKKALNVFIAFLVLTASSSYAKPSQDQALEIYISGKKYQSFHDYKLEQLKVSLKKNLALLQGEEKKDYIDNIYKNFTDGVFAGYSESEIMTIVAELNNEIDGAVSKVDDEQVTELEEILEEYQKSHSDAPQIDIDPEKVKTIIISPHENLYHQ